MIDSNNGSKLRHELKYRINSMQHQILKKRFLSILEKDPHSGPDGRYLVRTLYFDDFVNSAIWEKESDLYKRSKYRFRLYNCDNSIIKFERKSKIGDHILKENVNLTQHEAELIISGDISFLNHIEIKLLKDFYIDCRCRLMRPAVIVEYEREAYIYPIGKLRITFDTGLRTNIGPSSFFDDNISSMGVIGEQEIIMEIKYNGVLPTFIRYLLLETIPPRIGISKFSLCRKQKIP